MVPVADAPRADRHHGAQPGNGYSVNFCPTPATAQTCQPARRDRGLSHPRALRNGSNGIENGAWFVIDSQPVITITTK
jgi:hypothetical protein